MDIGAVLMVLAVVHSITIHWVEMALKDLAYTYFGSISNISNIYVVAGSFGKSLFKLLRNHHAVSPKDYIPVPSSHQFTSFSVTQCFHRYLLYFAFLS